MADGFNRKGYHYPEVVEDSECVNCKLCEMLCPEFSIYSLPLNGPDSEAVEKLEEVPS